MNFCIPILFSIETYFIYYTYFTHTEALKRVTEDVTNSVTHRIFNTNI